MPRLTITLCLLLIIASCKNQSDNEATKGKAVRETNISDSCNAEIFRARQDAAAGSLKYYVYGIALPSKDLIGSYRQKNIEVVSLGCVLPDNLLCYNKIADSVLHGHND